MQLTNPSVIRALMERHGFRFSKSLGQNFIINPSVCPRIAEEAGITEETGVIEIGPGIGVLTAELSQRAKKVVSIEVDNRLLPVLEETLADCDNVKVIHGDVLKADLHQLIAQEFAGMEVAVCANLPYYITSPIIMKLLEDRLPIRSITVMVQKEAAQRICAELPSRQAGAITAAIHYYSSPRQLFTVSPGSFMPPPDVQSTVIRLDLWDTPPVEVQDEAMLFRVIKGAFSQRRKTLLNCLASFFGMGKDALTELIRQAGVDPMARAEQLTLADFASLANVMGRK